MSAAIATQVRDFYERLPYPPPVGDLDEQRALYRNPLRRRALFHLMWPAGQPETRQTILIAGCGTSQAARYALREPDADIIAIDVSEASLRHTRDLRRKYDLHNLDVRQLPIERVQELGCGFDQVVCTGVLHHLPDPDLGLRALRGVLNPQGAMHLMVYAPHGRAGIYLMQAYCRLLGIGTSETELRDLGATLDGLPAEHPISNLRRHASDFRRPDTLADALLHPLDRAYDVPQLYDWLERCGMSFGRWVEQAPYLPQCGMIARSPHAAGLAALPSPLQHAAVELFRGTMVSHSLIAYRDDHAGETQPITFAGDRWRDYVPIVLPWTACVRERLPPCRVAALVNRAHKCADLVCLVDAFEDRLLEAIDGTRTLAGILRLLKIDNGGTDRALGFFERLWRYDQIVFDAFQKNTENAVETVVPRWPPM